MAMGIPKTRRQARERPMDRHHQFHGNQINTAAMAGALSRAPVRRTGISRGKLSHRFHDTITEEVASPIFFIFLLGDLGGFAGHEPYFLGFPGSGSNLRDAELMQ